MRLVLGQASVEQKPLLRVKVSYENGQARASAFDGRSENSSQQNNNN